MNVPVFEIEISTDRRSTADMTYLHMSHRYGPVTTARLLAGDVVERFNRERLKIVGMTMRPVAPKDREGAL